MPPSTDNPWTRTLWRMALLPLAAFLAITLLIETTGAELRWCRYFFGGYYLAWPHLEGAPGYWIDRLTVLPGYALALAGLGLAIGSFVSRSLRTWRRAGLFLVLLLLLGPGLVVNAILKPHWGRPRPEETSVFSGPETYSPPWAVRWGAHGRSFPSGHASIAFYIGAPAFLCSRRRGWAWTWGLLGVSYGIAVGLTRMIQGQHFPTDVLWSGAIVYFTGLGLYMLLSPSELSLSRTSATTAQVSPSARMETPQWATTRG